MCDQAPDRKSLLPLGSSERPGSRGRHFLPPYPSRCYPYRRCYRTKSEWLARPRYRAAIGRSLCAVRIAATRSSRQSRKGLASSSQAVHGRLSTPNCPRSAVCARLPAPQCPRQTVRLSALCCPHSAVRARPSLFGPGVDGLVLVCM